MPTIKGMDLSNGIRIIHPNGSENIWTLSDMNIALAGKTIAQAETIANNYLAPLVPYDQIRVHIYSLAPLKFNIIVANADSVLPPNWWV